MQKFIEPQMVRVIHKKPEKTMTIEMVHLPKGRFMFGEGDNKKEVIINYEFEMGKYQVTFDEYDMYCEDENIEKPSDEGWGRGRRPVINVNWYDAVVFCEWLSKKSAQNYRLPTEKEWEYACRAGTLTKWSFGINKSKLGDYAWYNKNSNNKSHEVGKKKSNPWGFYDMHGNIWEWCEDWGDRHETFKVVRGGSWYFDASDTYSFYRNSRFLELGGNNRGFRLLRILP